MARNGRANEIKRSLWSTIPKINPASVRWVNRVLAQITSISNIAIVQLAQRLGATVHELYF